jgi:hypothetical protein
LLRDTESKKNKKNLKLKASLQRSGGPFNKIPYSWYFEISSFILHLYCAMAGINLNEGNFLKISF